MTLTVTTKAELPHPPVHPPAYLEQDKATVHTLRREREGSYDSNQSSGSEGEGSDSKRQAEMRQHLADTQLVDEPDVELDDDLDGRTMLNLVVLPAIASVHPLDDPEQFIDIPFKACSPCINC